MNDKLPITLIAQIDDIAVFQTAAFFADSTFADSSDNIMATDANLNVTASENLPSYGELNLGLHVNDEAKTVLNNRMRLLAAINTQLASLSTDEGSKPQTKLSIKQMHWVNQIHGKQIHDIDATALSMTPMAADAMVSQQDSIGLAIMTADCVPIVLYQPATGQIAAIHAGWQGLACGVIQATAERFDDSERITAWIGVCISQANYEVSRDVGDRLRIGCLENKLLTTADLEDFEQRYIVASSIIDNSYSNDNATYLHNNTNKLSSCATVESDKVKIYLPKLAADQLAAAGISIATQPFGICSYADPHYYSYRRQTHLQQPATGRMALIITRSASI